MRLQDTTIAAYTMSNLISRSELARLEALRQYYLLDTNPDQGFDDITNLAAYICQTPIAITVLVDRDRLWFKSRHGIEVKEVPRERSFCSKAVVTCKTLVVEDALADRQFADSPLVAGEPHIRFYLGAPLINPSGFALGTLCAIDRKPHSVAPEAVTAMESLARQVVSRMELLRVAAELATALEGMRTLRGLLPICAWCKSIRNDAGYWERVEEYLRKQVGSPTTHGICPDCLEQQMKEI